MSTSAPRPTATRRRPRVHPVNTLVGLVFLAAAGAWAAQDQDVLDGDQVGQVVAVALIVLGVLGLVATLVVSRRGRTSPAPATTTASDADAYLDPDVSTDDDGDVEADRRG